MVPNLLTTLNGIGCHQTYPVHRTQKCPHRRTCPTNEQQLRHMQECPRPMLPTPRQTTSIANQTQSTKSARPTREGPIIERDSARPAAEPSFRSTVAQCNGHPTRLQFIVKRDRCQDAEMLWLPLTLSRPQLSETCRRKEPCHKRSPTECKRIAPTRLKRCESWRTLSQPSSRRTKWKSICSP